MTLRIALDAMGGDQSAPMVVSGAARFLAQTPKPIHFSFFGDASIIEKELDQFPALKAVCTVTHSPSIVTNETKPIDAIRMGKRSNMGMAIQSVAQGENQAVVSAGNTGAYMALSKIILRTLPDIDRPAIPAIMPTINGKTLMLDLGANVECTARQLLQFALMGEALAHIQLGIDSPTIGVLNIGSEALKGNDIVQEAAALISEVPTLNFKGFVEGDDIGLGKTDVVVTDGFTGNVALKSIEGTARLIKHFMTESFSQNLFTKLAYLIALPAIRALKRKADPRLYNGAVFLGLQHIAIKSHGGTDALGFANAIGVAVSMIEEDLISQLRKRLESSAPAKPPQERE
jgi:glycerol-3-phosphate acyltransferase PlsX